MAFKGWAHVWYYYMRKKFKELDTMFLAPSPSSLKLRASLFGSHESGSYDNFKRRMMVLELLPARIFFILIVTSFTFFICLFEVNSIYKKSAVASLTCLISTFIGVVDFEAEADLGDRRVGLEVQKLLSKLFPRNRHL
jgi:hypothetical protein